MREGMEKRREGKKVEQAVRGEEGMEGRMEG